ncbi:STAS domain-containing protein [Streptomyces boluensis]|uniref:STAS domain-containing protein n=1 Tax=Streptomyces boluensis TaxID=1775135 RepID=A0A964XL33_9ACTN|nr:STAS domain-containing protein [Streptomyces boluensis]NBE52900.1 STAS domain-containing protein [Streptomyces boluensis]
MGSDTTALLREAIVQVASRPDDHRRGVTLDLSALTYCDNAGLFTLLGICQALDAIGIRVAIPWTGVIADAAIERAVLQDRLPLHSA